MTSSSLSRNGRRPKVGTYSHAVRRTEGLGVTRAAGYFLGHLSGLAFPFFNDFQWLSQERESLISWPRRPTDRQIAPFGNLKTPP